MSKRLFRLVHDQARKGAIAAISEAPDGYIVTVAEPTRNLEQNARLWASLAEVANQVEWYGNKLTAEEWKTVFSAALKKEKVVPGINGGFVVCGQSTSKMSKREFSDMLEIVYAFGAERGVVFSDPMLEDA